MAKKNGRYHSSFISIDQSAQSLCPRGVMEKTIPNAHQETGRIVPDLYSGVSQLMGEDVANIKRQSKMTKKA
jgi:hypothetical protein